MNVVASAITLSVTDAAASSKFFCTHLGYREAVTGEDFVCLERDDAGVEIVLVQRNPEYPPAPAPGPTGLRVSFSVTDIARIDQRLRDEGAPLTGSLHRAPDGHWLLELTDPNGVEVHLTQWAPPSGA
ncbi:VOC family protein [Nocardia huaxiensis]|uniref:VOC family protein n=1 Tax=Nocardia huaxiensis TaxID=2755382 RepID=A0A7D6ZG24_9NOCA|nr:VOC family protein [Nocardia huaxiensis]QLY30079.1 VOC family protein [Nocardia huaxiensis]